MKDLSVPLKQKNYIAEFETEEANLLQLVLRS